ncbi:MAG: sialate O-acetylesterase [Lachnospiraceae bacterium]|nr:sialate O-acetylesterase [Lachnospiraceae bacterium]
MLQIAAIFQDGMVLQREKPVTVWGTHAPAASVIAEIQGKGAGTVADEQGKWQLTLPALFASESEQLVIRSEEESYICRDVAVGEVWVAGGQSNMEYHMRYEKHLKEALKDCPNRRIRFFDVPEVCYDGQLSEFDYSRQNIWRYASAEDLEYFSAVGYYFEKAICEDLDVPVGVIGCNWGGTTASAWMNLDTVKECGLLWFLDYEKRISKMDPDTYWKKQHHNPMNDRGNLFADPFSEFVMPRTPPRDELMDFFSQMSDGFDEYFEQMQPQEIPGSLYEHMLKTIAPYAIRGFLWYQGESDDVSGKNILYKDMLTGLIADWRTLWDEKTLPFLIVQLPGFDTWLLDTETNHYPIIRRCQEQVADTVNETYLCSISDVGEEKDIHPKNKKAVGERLALLARGHVYNEDILCDAPRAISARKSGREIMITFCNAGEELQVTGDSIDALKLYVSEQEVPYIFRIEENRLILTLSCETKFSGCTESEETEAVQVKFAQTPWFIVNIYNQAGIPAVPFEFVC